MNNINWTYVLDICDVEVPITVYEIDEEYRFDPGNSLYFLKYIILVATEKRRDAEYGLFYDQKHDRFVAQFMIEVGA